jgi:hypothetical protein
MGAISQGIDGALALLKWPVAAASLVFLPGLVYSLLFVLRAIVASPSRCYPFLVGAAIYGAFWLLVIRRRHHLGFLATLEHEFTHALFAWATLHRVIGFRATLRSGGHIRYVGRGNWLIATAPYFFPTLSLAAIAIMNWLPGRDLTAAGVVLGLTVAYHALSNWSETHRHQSDLREAGLVFSILFLIAANALVFGLLLSYACGLRSLTAHLEHVGGPTIVFFRWLLKLILPG